MVVSNLICKNNRFLLVQEAKKEVENQWNLPSGSVNQKEPLIEGAKRECVEESGLKVEPDSLNGVYTDWEPRYETDVMVLCFNSKIISGEIDPKDTDIKQAKFFSPDEIENLELRAEYILKAIRRFENNKTFSLELLEDIR